MNVETITYSLLGGTLPALIWLSFWLREDYRHPEPRGLILRTFLFGMMAVILIAVMAIIFQDKTTSVLKNLTLPSLILLASVEELLKFAAAYFGGLASTDDNEPIDPIIYMITAALGFVAMENTLFLFSGYLIEKDIVGGVIDGNLRFIGASLLHVVSSGIVGVSLAFTFYKSMKKHVIFTIIALMIASTLHTIFNLAIVHWGNSGIMLAFGLVWIGVVLLLLAFEKSKAIGRLHDRGKDI